MPLPRQVRSVEESNAILEMLMGKPDSTTMREKLEYAQNEENDVEKRIEALDDFEMVSPLGFHLIFTKMKIEDCGLS